MKKRIVIVGGVAGGASAAVRARMGELPRKREIPVHCQGRQRSYFVCRIPSQHGFQVRNLTGSYQTWKTATARNGSS